MTIRAEHIVAVINNASDTVALCIAAALPMVASKFAWYVK